MNKMERNSRKYTLHIKIIVEIRGDFFEVS